MNRTRTRITHLLIAPAAAATLLLAGCGTDSEAGTGAGPESAAGAASASSDDAGTPDTGSSDAGSSDAGSSGAASSGAATGGDAAAGNTVKIEITDAAGCSVTPTTVAAGPVTFDIVNVDATAVTEVHLMSGDRIRGERENLAPGFDNTFSATLDGGAYEIYCPGAAAENQPFTVTGEAAVTTGTVTELLTQAAADYGDYVSAQAGFLVETVDEFAAAVESGDLEMAKAAYAKARPFFERIEPVAESFGDLDPDIDARAGDVAPKDWKGFHPMEQALFADKDVAKAKPYVADLVANVAKLKSLTDDLAENTAANDGSGYQPDEVANGAASLLEEVQKTKITGEEERYSHIDLVDFAANVEGSQQAFAALVPALDEIDPTLSGPISERFKTLIELLDAQQDTKALGGYTLYTDLSKADVKKLSDALLAVQEPLSQVSAKVASAG